MQRKSCAIKRSDHKATVPQIRVQLHDRILHLEDFITSFVFSTFESLPPKYLKEFLVNTGIKEKSPFKIVRYDFWPRKKIIIGKDMVVTTPELLIETNNSVIVVEAKYKSGQSGGTQYVREGTFAIEEVKNLHKKAYFLLISKDGSLPMEVLKKIEKSRDIEIRSTSWHEIFPVMERIAKRHKMQYPQAKDLCDFLKKLDLATVFDGFKFLKQYDKCNLKIENDKSLFYYDAKENRR